MRLPAIRDVPIARKLLIIIMLTTAAALAVAGVGIVAFDYTFFRGYLKRDLTALARIIADNSTAAISFDDPAAAAETLAALRARDHAVTACIYRANATILAEYQRPGSSLPCPAPERTDSIRFAAGNVYVSHPIMLHNGRIGTLVIVYDLGEVTERFKLYGTTVLGVLLVSSLLAFLLSSKLRAVITDPIAQLVQVTTSVSENHDYRVRATKISGDELGLLVDRFNEMLSGIQSRDDHLTHALQDRETALHEAESARERFRFMAESMPQKIYTAAANGNVDYFNRQWTEFTGRSFDEIRNWGWTQFIHPDDLERNLSSWRQALQTGEPYLIEHRFLRADGEYRWHLSRAHAMRDAQGRISMWIGSSTEIQDQKEKEQELRLANEDLQQFAYSASHDLQEPIRNVSVYSEIIARRYERLLDDEGRQFLGYLTEGGRRLATLINDLLAYTRAGMTESNLTIADAGHAVRQAISNLAEAIRESGAIVAFEDLPKVYMSETHLQQVFQNLIGNALKYRAEEPPRIRISAVAIGGAWRFSVEDNGIGIDPQYREKIFGVFKRLHRDLKYSGTGIGLAICQRVVQRYGGRIWVESSPGRGATFLFTVPDHAPRTHTADTST